MMGEEKMWQAVKDSDASYDGKLFYGVKTTGICCRPSCPSKLPKRENVVFVQTREEAEEAGFRPCKRCRPDLSDYDPAAELSQKTKELVDRYFDDRVKLSEDRKEMGVSWKHLSEVFKKRYSITPSECLIQVRISAAKRMLQDGYGVLDASLMAGYENLSEFYEHFRRESGMTPARYRELFASNISRSVLPTPIGPLRIIASRETILSVEKAGQEKKDAGKEAEQVPADRILSDDASGELLKRCEQELSEYFAGERKSFDLPLAPEGMDFQKSVWKCLQTIPYGETRTYGELAAMVGKEKASRAVGMANHSNPILILIPCHRVIGADGNLTGYAAGIEAKKFLLELEKENAR